MWRIEQLKPVPVPVANHGIFHVGDSYIVLKTVEKAGTLSWVRQ